MPLWRPVRLGKCGSGCVRNPTMSPALTYLFVEEDNRPSRMHALEFCDIVDFAVDNDPLEGRASDQRRLRTGESTQHTRSSGLLCCNGGCQHLLRNLCTKFVAHLGNFLSGVLLELLAGHGCGLRAVAVETQSST